MVSTEHLELSLFIKTVHQNLRNNSKLLGVGKAWKEHCSQKCVLEKYSNAMRELSTKYWEKNFSSTQSRVQWAYNFCDHYFFKGEMLRQRIREKEIASKINLTMDMAISTFNNKISLLDVGSCYNPFQAFKCFDILPIDIAPATKDVFRCDFINIKIVDPVNATCYKSEIFELPADSFDVVVFSLLLEYLPCPDQRLLCCINAYKLLKFEGLLIIITPDSKHVGANVKFIKSWRCILASLGFSRIKYDKLIHVHCMAFRKSLKIEIADRWKKLQINQDFFNKMYIPQDFNKGQVDSKVIVKNTVDSNKLMLFKELPYNIY